MILQVWNYKYYAKSKSEVNISWFTGVVKYNFKIVLYGSTKLQVWFVDNYVKVNCVQV